MAGANGVDRVARRPPSDRAEPSHLLRAAFRRPRDRECLARLGYPAVRRGGAHLPQLRRADHRHPCRPARGYRRTDQRRTVGRSHHRAHQAGRRAGADRRGAGIGPRQLGHSATADQHRRRRHRSGSTPDRRKPAAERRCDIPQPAAEKYDRSTFHGQPPTAGDIAALFHTGGTTGKPKPAAHTHANEVTDAWMIAANSLLDDDSVLFAGLPLFHVNALVVTLLAPLLRGQQAVWAGPLGYRDTALYANFWKIVQEYTIAAMSAVPTVVGVL